jgi:holo-[acyl-carrier protein] synthase
MLTGIGTDMVAVQRFARPFGPRFFSRVFTEYERTYMQSKPLPTMAGLFAAKEAVAKALGTGFAGFWPNAIEIRHDAAGKPYVILHGVLARLLDGHALHISISHTHEYATAFAVLEKI